MRLKDKIAIVVGAGQSPGEGTGNGRATAMVFAREGATVACVDMLQERAEETAAIIRGEGNQAFALAADVTKEASLKAMVDAVMAQCGRIDILHNNVGVSIAGGDKPLEELTEEDFDRCNAINLRGMIMTCKHVVPVMRAQKSGAIVNISSMAVRDRYPLVARSQRHQLRRRVPVLHAGSPVWLPSERRGLRAADLQVIDFPRVISP